jgi:cell fate regulator YaaT (PSP1 superfamily)
MKTMACSHLVRTGAMAQVGAYSAVDGTRYPRGSRVVLRTWRGLELGEVLAPSGDDSQSGSSEGAILRGMTIEDQLLEARLLKNRDAAYEACQARIEALALPATLMDVEHLFDGQTLVFYFLGELTPQLEAVTSELAEVYDAQAQFRSFTELMTQGCGPGCGTEHAEGAGCGSCSTGCAVADACSVRRS